LVIDFLVAKDKISSNDITTTFPHFKEAPKFSCLIHLPCLHSQHNLSMFQKVVVETPTRYKHCYANIDLREGKKERKL
jgi:hypothetical protein